MGEARAEVAEGEFAECEEQHCENEIGRDEGEIAHYFIA